MSWLRSTPPLALFISAVTIGELQRGAEMARKVNPLIAQDIEGWIDVILSAHQILPVAAESARESARLLPSRSDTHLEAALIAATARVHGLTVATRNERDFTRFRVQILNPFLVRS
jgi:predicted nucleic acid-binding protein